MNLFRKKSHITLQSYLLALCFDPTTLIEIAVYMLLAGWEVRIGKNCDRGCRPRAAFSSLRSQFFPIRTDPKQANNIFLFLFWPWTETDLQVGLFTQLCHWFGLRAVYKPFAKKIQRANERVNQILYEERCIADSEAITAILPNTATIREGNSTEIDSVFT